MFFLLRMAFWLGLVLVLLPRDKTPESEKLPQIGVADAVQAATAAVSDMSQFCKRQPAGLRGRRPGRDHDRPARPGRRAQDLPDHHRQEDEQSPTTRTTDKKAPDHTGSIALAGEGDAACGRGAARHLDARTTSPLEWRGPAPAPANCRPKAYRFRRPRDPYIGLNGEHGPA